MVLLSSGNVMVRDYSSSAGNWSPAIVSRQTGPVSYECKLQRRGVVRNHQDQIIDDSPTTELVSTAEGSSEMVELGSEES